MLHHTPLSVFCTMSDLPDVATRLSKNVEILVDEIDKTGSQPGCGKPTALGAKGLAARDEIILAAEKLLQQGRGPGPSLLSLLESVAPPFPCLFLPVT